MRRFIFYILSLLMSFSSVAQADYRNFHVYAGGGLSKSFATVQRSGNESQFNGWSLPLVLGMDVPFNKDFGFFIRGTYGNSDFKNSQDSDLKIETLEITSQGFVGGFFLRGLGVGFGKEKSKINIDQVSTETGSLKYSADGEASAFHVHYIFDFQKTVRFSIEADYKDGSMDDYEYKDLSAGLKFFFLF